MDAMGTRPRSSVVRGRHVERAARRHGRRSRLRRIRHPSQPGGPGRRKRGRARSRRRRRVSRRPPDRLRPRTRACAALRRACARARAGAVPHRANPGPSPGDLLGAQSTEALATDRSQTCPRPEAEAVRGAPGPSASSAQRAASRDRRRRRLAGKDLRGGGLLRYCDRRRWSCRLDRSSVSDPPVRRAVTSVPHPDIRRGLLFERPRDVRDLPALQREIRRVLRPDGVIVHVLPTSAWRVWSAITYYVALAREVRAYLRNAIRRRSAAAASARARPENRPRLAWRWLAYLAPRRHGEVGSWLSEIYLFSRRRWVREFSQAEFAVRDSSPRASSTPARASSEIGSRSRRAAGSRAHSAPPAASTSWAFEARDSA